MGLQVVVVLWFFSAVVVVVSFVLRVPVCFGVVVVVIVVVVVVVFGFSVASSLEVNLLQLYFKILTIAFDLFFPPLNFGHLSAVTGCISKGSTVDSIKLLLATLNIFLLEDPF